VNPMLEIYIRAAETRGTERGVTLVVGGMPIKGIMTPRERFAAWTSETSARSELAGGATALPAIEIPPLTDEERERIREEWAEVTELDLTYFCLRNAEMKSGAHGEIERYRYLLIRTEAVDAFCPGVAGAGWAGRK
jgi:hypothetical protein